MTDDDPDLQWLLTKARDRRDAVFVYWIDRGIDKADAASKAGYSAGRSDDPGKRRKALQTSASGALKSNRIQALMATYQLHKLYGDKSQVASEQEVLERLTEVMRTASDASVISSAKGFWSITRSRVSGTKWARGRSFAGSSPRWVPRTRGAHSGCLVLVA